MKQLEMKLFVLVGLVASLCNVCHTKSNQKSLKAVTSKSNWEFTKSLYTVMVQTSGSTSNIIFSPLSLQVILALCYMGTGGETAKQVSKALYLPNSPDQIKSGFQQLLKKLPGSGGDVTLDIANIIYSAHHYSILATFKDIANKAFSSDIKNINFKDTSKAAGIINTWVNEKTGGKITSILSGKSLSAGTLMVLVNAVYFKGMWEAPFQKKSTSKATFYVHGKHGKSIDMMHINRWFNYVEHKGIGAKLVELPYKDKSTSLVIVLPSKQNGLASVEAKLAKENLRKILELTKQKSLYLSLPRFSLEQTSQLVPMLKEMGVVDMFSCNSANFSLMSAGKGVCVSSVLHRAMVEVSEEGTVAAAASSSLLAGRGLAPPSLSFIIDHPFLFALVSRREDVVLFAGRYTGDDLATPNMIERSVKDDVGSRNRNGASSLIVTWSGMIIALSLFSLRVLHI